jgi:catechol 2,3-dioxygenase-like lactoylglutathione lyase family enzyme
MKRTQLLLFALSFAGFLQAQDSPSFNFTFNHVALSVKDLDLAVDFYKNFLNLQEITNKSRIEGVRWFAIGENKELHLISTVKESVSTNKAVHLALTTDHFDALIKALVAKNIVYSDWPGASHKINIRADGIKQVFFQDPDGYWIEVNSF